MRWVYIAQAASDIYNAGTGVASTFVDMITAYFHARGESPSIGFIPMPETLSAQYQNLTQADMSTLRLAGFQATPTLPGDGVAETLKQIRRLAVM